MRRRLKAVTVAWTPAIRLRKTLEATGSKTPTRKPGVWGTQRVLRTCGRDHPAVTDQGRYQLLGDHRGNTKILLPWFHSGLPPFSVPTIWLTSWLFSTQKYSMISVFTIKGECPNSVNGLVYAPGSSMVTSNSRCPESGRRKRSVTCS